MKRVEDEGRARGAAALRVTGVKKRFGGVRALDGVTFVAPRGAIFGLIGPNGAGKTTLFNVVTGVTPPDEGSIRLEDRELGGIGPAAIARLGVGRTFQNIRLFAQLTVRENLWVAGDGATARIGEALARGGEVDEGDVRPRATELLDAFGLARFAELRATSLAYGDQRRLEIARALMTRPRVLLLDEPAAGMNDAEARTLAERLREVRARYEVTLVLVEHNVDLVMRVCEEVHVLDRGASLASGAPEAIRADPRVIAAYLGSDRGARDEARDRHRGSGAPAVTTLRAPQRKPAHDVAETKRPLLELETIRVRYGAVEAVRDLSLRVMPGEVVALVGANGAGKSTTLRAIARLLPLAAGTVRFAGEDLAPLPADEVVRRGVSLVPEGRALFADLTVAENLAMGAFAHRDAAAMAETRGDVVRLFPRLGERFRQRAATLSGGEQQMLAIGRALMARPSLLLLDEPSLGIAPTVVEAIFEALRSVVAGGITLLLVEQNTRLALATSQRAYVLRAGACVHEGESAQLASDERLQEAYLG